jgi:signal transduction histidine kinase
MHAAVEGIRHDTLDDRVPVPATRDELAGLAGAFNGLLGRLQKAFERQRRFTGEASHQLRTPLTAILGQMEVALRRDRDPDKYRRVLATAFAQADRLREIVEALLFLARADTDTELPGREPLDLGRWLNDYLADAWGRHPRFADLQVEAVGASLVVSAHPVLFGQAVGNLIENAVKYGPPGTAIPIGLTVESGGVMLSVADHGSGIAVADRPLVFEPFYRSAESRRYGVPGVGLGLAVTARIIRAHGGHVRIGSVGTGCRVEIALPQLPTR